MKDIICHSFQTAVDECLVRHKSVMDVMSKLSESTSRVNRAVAKAVTTCGCVQVQAQKQVYPAEVPLAEMSRYVASHISGELCEQCREAVDHEIGRNLFYLTALCSVLGLSLYDSLLRENSRLSTLGAFNLI
jgi:hypothetical protein